MNYLVIGAGGVGSALAAFLKKGERDVTLLARGKRLEAINKEGLTVNKKEESFTVNVKAVDDCWDKKDVIFICVKDYSLDDILPYVKRASGENTVIIPLLNVYGTGERLKSKLFAGDVLNGCVYITAEKEKDNSVFMSGNIFRVVFGNSNGNVEDSRYKEIEKDLNDCGIRAILSPNVLTDTFKKFVFISPMAAAGAFLDCEAKFFKQVGFAQTLFLNCTAEVCNLAQAMGITLPDNMVENNLKLMNAVADTYICSMHKDVRENNKTEMDGLVFNVVRLAKQFKVNVPTYTKISEYFGFRIPCDCENRVEISGEVC